jgi:hypothetical protein
MFLARLDATVPESGAARSIHATNKLKSKISSPETELAAVH